MLADELNRFNHFLTEQINLGATLSPEEALDAWRAENPPEDDDTVEVLREALAAMKAGDRGMPLEEFDRDFRQRHGLPPRP